MGALKHQGVAGSYIPYAETFLGKRWLLGNGKVERNGDRFLAQGAAPYPRLSSCSHCANKHPNMATCHAFVSGIPLPLLNAEHDHRSTYDGDSGIRYEADLEALQELKSLGWL